MDPGGPPNSFAPSGNWFRFVHRFVPGVDAGILHSLTGSILFHSGMVLALAVFVTAPPSLDRQEASLVFALPEPAEQEVGEITLVVSDASLPRFASNPDSDRQVDLSPPTPNFSNEIDFPAVVFGHMERAPLPTSIAPSSWTLEEDEDEGESVGESTSAADNGFSGASEDDELPMQPDGEGTEFFGLQGRGNQFVYVVDCSRSMIGEKWNRVRQELVRSLDELKPEQSFYIILFDGHSHPMFGPSEQVKGMLPATSDNIAKARRWVMSFQLGANTSPLASVTHAMRLKPHAVFLLTDGEFADATAQWLRDHNRETRIGDKPRVRVPVHTIGIFNKKTQRLLKRIARENNGQFQFVPEPRP